LQVPATLLARLATVVTEVATSGAIEDLPLCAASLRMMSIASSPITRSPQGE
jgi:hypothetical protein